jgi:hypothetical protein
MGSSLKLSLDRIATARRSDITMRANLKVDATARIQSSIAGPIMMRNSLPWLRSNDLLGCAHSDHANAA